MAGVIFNFVDPNRRNKPRSEFDYLYVHEDERATVKFCNYGMQDSDSRIDFRECDPHKKVSEIIGEEWESWNCYNPIYIFTPTGSGKNTFIKNNLVKPDNKILLISNRIALNIQMKKELINLVMDNETLKKHVNDWAKQKFLSLYKEQTYGKLEKLWLKDNKKFGNLHICNYQGLMSLIKENEISGNKPYTHVVCDEAHFFSSDAEFNVDTYNILEAIQKNFYNSIRIYMTATPDRVFKYIFEKHNPNKQIVYGSKADYSYIEPIIIDDIQELCELIIHDKSKEKWLVFVNNKKNGKDLSQTINKALLTNNLDIDEKKKILAEEIKENLTEESLESVRKKIDAFLKKTKKPAFATFICAGEDNVGEDNESLGEYTHKLVESQGFAEKVLITTAVLDNGFSFSDELIKNIVIMNLDKVAFLQMLGRKRVKEEEKINLFLVKPSEKHVSGVKEILTERLNVIKLLEEKNFDKIEEKYYNGTVHDFEKIVGLIKISKGKYIYNKLAKKQIREKLDFYEQTFDNKDDPYWANKEQLRWIGKYKDGDSIEDYRFGKPKKKLINFLEKNIGLKIPTKGETISGKTMDSVEEQMKKGEIISDYIKFLYDFRFKYDSAYIGDKSSKVLYSINKINEYFGANKDEFPYIIHKEKINNDSYITLLRIGTEDESK